MSTLKLTGSSSGNAQVTVAAAAGTPTITLPTASIDLSSAGSDGQFLKTNGSGTLSFDAVSTVGTYEPSITVTTGSFTWDSSYNTLAYVKIGRFVHVQGQLRVGSTSGASTLTIGLPFAVAALTEDSDLSNIPMWSSAGEGGGSDDISGIFLETQPGTSTGLVHKERGGVVWSNPTVDDFPVDTVLGISGGYITT